MAKSIKPPLGTVFDVFRHCAESIHSGVLISRESSRDKEFHFQNWFIQRLIEMGRPFEQGGRNSYPDFRMVELTDGYELKGLAYPGRDANFDSNSQAPTGHHNGRSIYYVFGRYPKEPDGKSFPVVDFVICHGDFLNADHEYRHKNKNIKGFGSYGDLMIRDRKMYVVPTPFHLLEGVAHVHTLILPAEMTADKGFVEVGSFSRIESNELIVGYSFDLKCNELIAKKIPNPGAGRRHAFRAWRWKSGSATQVTIRPTPPGEIALEVEDDPQ